MQLVRRFEDQQWDDFYQLSVFLVEICQSEIDIHDTVPTSLAQSMSSITSILSGFLIVTLVMCNVVYFPVIINRLNRSAKYNRALLLLLPQDVLTGVKVLKEMMSTLTKRLL